MQRGGAALPAIGGPDAEVPASAAGSSSDIALAVTIAGTCETPAWTCRMVWGLI